MRLITILLAMCISTSAWSTPTTWKGKVVRVLDADTVDVLRPGAKGCWTIQRVRIQGIDAPEKKQAFGKAATKFAVAFVFGRDVTVNVNGKGKYGRWLGDLCRGKSKYKCLSYQLVRKGWAWHYRKYSKSRLLDRAEKKAKKETIGLWAGKTPLAPWLWRKKSK